jgi:hypothetical protein
MKVFLGGTVNKSDWRDKIIPLLKVDYYNPVVEDWNEEVQQREIEERESADFNLYVLTPKMEGFYSIAEVADDSFKKADKTIFCYLTEDDGKEFGMDQLDALEKIGKLVVSNGGIWKHTLDDVVSFLNSSVQTQEHVRKEKSDFKNVFISYGRRHSLDYARKLYYKLTSQGQGVWFDMNDIPIGVDFQEQIDEGIQKADNFIFIISPHSVNSIYCYKEIVLAKKYNKRIIPILHVEPEGLWNKLHPDISKLNWIYARQKENFDIPIELWQDIDDFNLAFENIVKLIDDEKEFVTLHTQLLNQVIIWEKNQRSPKLLLHGNKRIQAMTWLLKRDFYYPDGKTKQAPVIPTSSQAEFIVESKKNAEYSMADCFLAYMREDFEAKETIRKQLNLNGFSTWSDTTDIKKGTRFKEAIEKGIAEADNFLFLISPLSVNSKETMQELDIAIKYKKRIIPLLVISTADDDLPIKLRSIQYIDFQDRTEKVEIEVKDQNDVEADVNARKEASPLQKSTNELLMQLRDNQHYIYQHKLILAQALKWLQYNKPDSMLFRDFMLDNAITWMKISENQNYKSNKWHKDFLDASQEKAGMLDSEVFISYEIADSDFARQINFELQAAGKTTWFIPETMYTQSNAEENIRISISEANNFLLILSSNSINDQNCLNELQWAIKQNKRIITLLTDNTEESAFPKKIAGFQYINFQIKEYNSAFAELLTILDTDKEHVKLHALYARTSLRWEESGKANDYLLRSQELREAEKWLDIAEKEKKVPPASTLQKEFIERSNEVLLVQLQKETQQRRIKRLFIFVVFLGIIALLFGVFAYRNYLVSEKQKQIAMEQREIAQKNEIIAKNMAEEARKQAAIAQQQSKIAMEQKAEAEKQRQIALEEKMAAEIARKSADSARILAEVERKKAMELQKIAQYNESLAQKQKKIAEQAEERAKYYLYAFNAKNMAGEALIQTSPDVQSYLSNTALELNHIADSLSKLYHIQHPYMPTVMQALQSSYMSIYPISLIPQQSKLLYIKENKIYFGNTDGGLSCTEIFIEEDQQLSVSNPSLLIDKEYGKIYSLIPIFNRLYFNTSESKIYFMENEKIEDISAFVSFNVSKLIKLPTASQMAVLLNNGNSLLFDANDFSRNITGLQRFSENKNLAYQLLSKLNNNVTQINQTQKITSLTFSLSPENIYTNNGSGKIIITNKQSASEFPTGHKGQISCITLSSNNQWIASGSYDGSIMIWALNQGSTENYEPIILRPSGAKYISALAFTEDNNYLIYADNRNIAYIPLSEAMLYRQINKKQNLTPKQENRWWEYYKKGEIEQYKGSLY